MIDIVWKDVEDYKGIYQVSSDGQVRSLDRVESSRGSTRTRRGRSLKQKINDGGYHCVHLRNKAGEKESWPPVHKLVAEAFIQNEENKPTVNHKNGNKLDNSVSNLEWATQKEQTLHAFSNNLMRVRGNTLYNEDFKLSVQEYHRNKNISLKKLAKVFNISERTTSRIVKGEFGDERKTPKHVIAKAMWLREQGFSLHKIGEIVGKDFSTIHNWATKRGLSNKGIRGYNDN